MKPPRTYTFREFVRLLITSAVVTFALGFGAVTLLDTFYWQQTHPLTAWLTLTYSALALFLVLSTKTDD